MGIPLDTLIATTTKEQARAQLLTAAQGLGWAQVDGDSEGTIALSGTPKGAYDIRIQVLTVVSGTNLTFKYSLDGGVTFSGSVAPTAGVYVLGATGLTVTFTGSAVDSFIAGDTFTVASFYPPLAVTSWGPFAVARVLLEIFAVGYSILKNLVKKIAAGGLLAYAKGAWLTMAADQQYDLERLQGVAAQGLVTLTDAQGAGPFSITSGVFLLQTAGGLRYRSQTSGTLPKNGTLVITVRAEGIGSQYNVGGHAITILGTPLPGVTADNDVSWITIQGTDDETDQELFTRCRARWSSLAPAFTDDGYGFYAKQASGAVARVKTQVDGTTAGQCNIYLAGSSGPVAGPVVTAVQTALDQIVPQCCTLNVVAATPHVFDLSALGTVYFHSAYSTTITQALSDAMVAFFASIDVGGSFYASQFIEAVQQVAGVRNYDPSGGVVDTAMSVNEVATYSNALAQVSV